MQRVSDDARRAVLKAMGIPAGNDGEIASSLAAARPVELGEMRRRRRRRFASCRNFCATAAPGASPASSTACAPSATGASAISRIWRASPRSPPRRARISSGVNPLHALFLAAPERCSPFSPSNRDFLNPLYIAIDRAPGFARHGRRAGAAGGRARLRAGRLPRRRSAEAPGARAPVPHLLRERLGGGRRVLRGFPRRSAASRSICTRSSRRCPRRWCSRDTARPGTAGRRNSASPARTRSRAFAEEQAELVSFHAWLQWLADRQLREAQARAIGAGMRIGLYLDLAVGVTPDGSATWSDRAITVPGARIGAPPDYFNEAGQDWGLAPMSPAGLVARNFEPYRNSLDIALRHAGAHPHRPRDEPLPALLDRRRLHRRRRRLCALPLRPHAA